LARVGNLLRRRGLTGGPRVWQVADVRLDEADHEATRAGHPLGLTATELRLLRELMVAPRRVLTRAQLLERVWGYDFGGDARVLETYVSYLRKKLDAHGPPLLHTVRGVGYVLREPRS
jgi:two-component system OmpR family response regulator